LKGVCVSRYSVRSFVQRQKGRLRFEKATVLEKDRHAVSLDEIKRCFTIPSGQIKSIPSVFVWNAEEVRVGCPKKTSQPEAVVIINTNPGCVTIREVRNDMQLTLLTAIPVFRIPAIPFSFQS
jgi:hypothetical protein